MLPVPLRRLKHGAPTAQVCAAGSATSPRPSPTTIVGEGPRSTQALWRQLHGAWPYYGTDSTPGAVAGGFQGAAGAGGKGPVGEGSQHRAIRKLGCSTQVGM